MIHGNKNFSSLCSTFCLVKARELQMPVPKNSRENYSKLNTIVLLLQGDPNQNPLFQMAVPLKLCISDPMLVKPKCV